MYTLQQLKALVAYAAERGIEIVPEIDVPAHTRYSVRSEYTKCASYFVLSLAIGLGTEGSRAL